MKWSQAICASILVDEFYTLSPHARSNLRSDLGVRVPSEPVSRPRLFAADWGFPRSPSEPGPRNCQPMPHEVPHDYAPGLYV
jgi:hypothetical protein